jgi:hypothetical protein
MPAMGHVVFVSADAPASSRSPRGAVVGGRAHCRVYVMRPEENAFGADFPGSMRFLRERLRPDGSFAVTAPKPTLDAEDAMIPSEVFATVPDAALVNFQWEFTPDACEVS